MLEVVLEVAPARSCMLEVADLAKKKIDGWPAHMLATIAKNGKIRARRTEKLGSSEFPGRCCTSKCWLGVWTHS